jgi:hypothetical protein
MRKVYGNLFWGIALILIGGFFLAVNIDLFPTFSESIWTLVFALISLLFFAGYFISGVKNWGLLFPAVGSGAIALTIWLATSEVDGTIVGGLFMVIISIPFWIGYLMNREKHWGLLIPGWIMGAIGLILLLAGRGAGELIGTLVMFAVAVPFFVVYLVNRQNWWALIPAWVMSAIGLIILLANRGADELIGALIMFAIALPFFVVYFTNRQNWWALIPAGILTPIGVIILLSNTLAEEAIGALIVFAVALPFFVTYSRNEQHWWALIPAGVLASVALTILLASIHLSEALEVRLLGGALFAGIGATFAVLWSRRKRHGTDWAKYPALGLGAAALTVLTFGAQVELVWSVVLIGLGLWMLYRAPRAKEKS